MKKNSSQKDSDKTTRVSRVVLSSAQVVVNPEPRKGSLGARTEGAKGGERSVPCHLEYEGQAKAFGNGFGGEPW